jgi:hypothetical protein
VNSQNIYLKYLNNRNALSKTDRNYLVFTEGDKNPYSGYIRSIYYKLTGEKIKIDFMHLNGKGSSPRAVKANKDSRLNVYPNPLKDDNFTVSINDYNLNSKYNIKIQSLEGEIVGSINLTVSNNRIAINQNQGVYI